MELINDREDIDTTAREHIDLLIGNVEELIDKKLDFQAFLVISIGIEFLGAFTDSFDFNEYGHSESRFTNAIDHWFSNKWYKENKSWIFKNLRGPIIHQYRPGKEILLTSFCKNQVDITHHLEISEGRTIFVLEQLFADFKKASSKLNLEFNKSNNPYKKTKGYEKYQSNFQIEKWDKTLLSSSGQTDTTSSEFVGKDED